MLDLKISGGLVLDGGGTPAARTDVGIRGGRIAAVGDLRGQPATQSLDAHGLCVAPGFIDIHAHDDFNLMDPRSLRPGEQEVVARRVCEELEAAREGRTPAPASPQERRYRQAQALRRWPGY